MNDIYRRYQQVSREVREGGERNQVIVKISLEKSFFLAFHVRERNSEREKERKRNRKKGVREKN